MTLPSGWSVKTLIDVADVRLGRQRSPQNHSGTHMRPYLRAANISWNGLKLDDVKSMNFTDAEMETFRLEWGDLLLSEASGSPSEVGKPAIWRNEIPGCAFQNTLLRVRSETIIPEYLLLYLRYQAITGAFSEQARGVGIHHLSRSKLAEWRVPCPPTDEQKMIVDILENHLSRLDAAASALSRSVQRIEIMRQVALTSAISHANEDSSSQTVTVGDLGRVGSGATPLKSTERYYEGGQIPWITSGDLYSGLVAAPKRFITDAALNETAVRLYPPGTLLVAMYGEGRTRGTVAELMIEATTNQACAAIVLREEFDAVRPWLKLVLTSNYWALRRLAAGGVQPNLSLGIVKALELPLPNIDVQKRLINEYEAQAASAARLGHEVRRAAVKTESLRKSVLKAAFTGRLTGQSADTAIIEELVSV